MDNAFREMFEGIRQTADGLKQATDGLTIAAEGIKRTADAALHASGEHEDLRETVSRLETLVMELVRRLDGTGKP